MAMLSHEISQSGRPSAPNMMLYHQFTKLEMNKNLHSLANFLELFWILYKV